MQDSEAYRGCGVVCCRVDPRMGAVEQMPPNEDDVSASSGIGDAWLNIFIDETGTHLTSGQMQMGSQFFICAAVLVDDRHLEYVAGRLDDIARELRFGSEIKSSAIGTNHRRRILLLEAVQDLPFQFVWLLVDKARILGQSGLRFQQSFHKFFKRLLQAPLANYAGTGIRVRFDQYGSPEFMARFEDYMRERVPPSLLFDYSVTHVDSAHSRLVQLADVIAGTLAQCLEPERRSPESERLRDLLAPKELTRVTWPPATLARVRPEGANEVDSVLEQRALDRAERLIVKLAAHGSSDDWALAVILEHLVFARTMEEGVRQSVYADKLVELLAAEGYETNSRAVRSAVSGLRDHGIVIAGTTNGYKLALTVSDIDEYLDHQVGVITPMLLRVDKARQSVKLDTAGDHDILGANWDELKIMVDSLAESRLPQSARDFDSEDAVGAEESEG